MARSRPAARQAGTLKVKTSLTIDPAVYDRAQHYKIEIRSRGDKKDLGEIVSEALDEYLKKRGA